MRAFKDPWLPARDQFHPITPLRFLHESVLVKDLIQDGHWCTELLEILFCSRDAEFIQSIPLCRDAEEDRLIWHYTPSGCFTVSSAYKLGLNPSLAPAASCSAQPKAWNILWHCKLPPKVCFFAWQLCHNALATGVNLHRRQIKRTACCMRCSDPIKSDIHIFFMCPYAKAAWQTYPSSPFQYFKQSTSWLHFFHTIVELHQDSYTELSKIIICLWGLWRARNDWIFSRVHREGGEVICRSLGFLSSFQTETQGAGISSAPDVGSSC